MFNEKTKAEGSGEFWAIRRWSVWQKELKERCKAFRFLLNWRKS